jgi:hypothetical protein
MLQSACSTGATERPDRHCRGAFARHNDPFAPLWMRPHSCEPRCLATVQPAASNAERTSRYFFGINLTVRLHSDVPQHVDIERERRRRFARGASPQTDGAKGFADPVSAIHAFPLIERSSPGRLLVRCTDRRGARSRLPAARRAAGQQRQRGAELLGRSTQSADPERLPQPPGADRPTDHVRRALPDDRPPVRLDLHPQRPQPGPREDRRPRARPPTRGLSSYGGSVVKG